MNFKKYLLSIIYLLSTVSFTFSQSRIGFLKEGYFEYSVEQNRLDTCDYWYLKKTRYKPFPKRKYKFFPSDYVSKGSLVNSDADNEFYYSLNKQIGSLKITRQDSIIYLGNTNSWYNGLDKQIIKDSNIYWHLKDGKLYRINQLDTIEYQIIKERSVQKILDIYDSKGGVWVKTPYGIYIINKNGGIRFSFHIRLGRPRYYYSSEKQILAFTKKGYYKFTPSGARYIDKSNSSAFSKAVNIKSYFSYNTYKDYSIFYDNVNEKGYFISDENDYVLDSNLSKIIGLDENGNLWGSSYNSDERSYYLNYLAKGWEDSIDVKKKPTFITVSNFTKETKNDIDLELSNIKLFNNAIYIFTRYNGVKKYYKGKYYSLSSIDGSGLSSIFEMLDLNDRSFIYNIPVELWSDFVYDKAIYSKKGIGYNFYKTNTDSNGDQWAVENNILYNRSQDYSYDIKKTFDSLGIIQKESLTYSSVNILNRLVVNKFDQIFMFGKRNIISFNEKEKKWDQFELGDKGYINYQKIYQDHIGNIWFQNKKSEIYYIENNKLNKVDLDFKEIEYWQIDNNKNLTIISDGKLYSYRVIYPKKNLILINTFKLERDIYSLNKIHTIINHEKGMIIKNTDGFYFFGDT